MSDKNSKNSTYKEKLLERHSEARIVRRIVLVVFIIILLVVSGVIGGGYLYIKSALKPVDPTSSEVVEVTIPIGSSPTTIAKILEENGIIKNAKVFRYYTKFKNESGFQAGEYKLSPSMTFDSIIENLKSGKIVEDVVFKLTIPEGKQLTEIATIIAERVGYSSDEVMKLLDDKEYIQKLMKKFPNLLTEEILNEDIIHPLEGYLYPATYPFYKEKPSLEEIVEVMIAQTGKIVEKYQADMQEKDYTPHSLLTFASLIEEEATEKTDREKISSVFYNRLDINMPLQTDPTVLYAWGKHEERVLKKHLEINSPYNTYQVTGLTPGPIANAGEMSIIAALYPTESDYLYFLAAPNGEVYFSRTLDEHNRLKNEHLSN